MEFEWYLIDAFGSEPFTGNPAAVVLLDEWLDDGVLAAMAAEHNQAETAFAVSITDGYEIRWFTPTVEVQLCGHATLATAFVLFTEKGVGSPIRFHTREAGLLTVERMGDSVWMDFPAYPSQCVDPPALLTDAIDQPVVQWRVGPNYLAVLADRAAVAAAVPDLDVLTASSALDDRGLIITASDDGAADFVSRYFAPGHGIDEDAVTGSAHCMLAPYWSDVLGRRDLIGHQISSRGGVVQCRVHGDRVHLGGAARLYLRGIGIL